MIVFLIITIVFANVVVAIIRRTKRVRNVVITEHNDHSVQVSENEAYGINPNTFMTQNTMYGTGHAEELTILPNTFNMTQNTMYGTGHAEELTILPNTFNMTQNIMYSTGHAEELTEDGVEN